MLALVAWATLLAVHASAADETAPMLASATVDWTRLTLAFDEDLDAQAIPAQGAFSVVVDGNARAVAGVAVAGDSVVLALTLPVSPTSVVTVAYVAPTESKLADAARNPVVSFAATAATNETPDRLATQGPGLGNLRYTAAEEFQPVSWITNIGPIGNNPDVQFGLNVGILLNGYFVTLFAPDGGGSPGGFLVYDVSDPRSIRLVRRIGGADTADFREAHSLPAARIGDSVYVAVQSRKGIEIWDFTDVNDIHRESQLRLPGVGGGDYSRVAWQTAWQAPYLYVSASSQGVYVVDTSDPAAPFQAVRGRGRPNPVPPAEYGGFRALPLFALGNHLLVTGMGAEGWSSLDIGNPVNPLLLDTVAMPESFDSYATCFDGRRVYSTPRGGTGQLIAYDVTDPAGFVLVDGGMRLGARSYCGTQDHFLFEGGQAIFGKIDTSGARWTEVGTATLNVPRPDAGQVAPMGNLVFVGNDHGTGSAFFVHDTDPDLTPPAVVEVSPRNGAANQLLTTSVGIAFSDSVLLESVGADSVRLLDPEGNVVGGTYSAQLGMVSLSPAIPLQPDTRYTVAVLAGGVSDYAGNRVETAFRSAFTTTPTLPVDPVHRWALEDDAEDWFDRNDGTIVGASFVSGGGLLLDGQGDWITLASSLSRVLSGNASIGFFLSTTQTGNAAPGEAPGLTGREDSGGTNDAYWGWLDDTGRLRLSIGNGDGIKSPQPVNDGQMHHYALTRDAASGALRMYRDGVRIAAGTGAAGPRSGGGSYDRLGTIEGNSASLAGTVEDIQIFDHVLGDYDVARLYGVADSGFTQTTRDAVGSVGVASDFEAEAQGDETTTYEWDFGDGSANSPSGTRTASHAYARAGHYTVVLTVTVGGRAQRYSFIKTVAYARLATAPTASSTIVGSGNVVYKTNPDNASVTGFDRRGLSKAWETGVGKNPRTVAVDTLGRAWVAVQGADRLACLDAAGNACGMIATGHGSAPFGIAFVPGTDTGLVSLQGSGEVLRFDAATATVLTRRAVNAEPRGIAISGDGTHAYVTRMRSTAAGLVTRIDASTLAGPAHITLQVDRTTTDAAHRARGKPNYLSQVVISPDGRTAWVPSKQDNVLRGKSRDGLALTHESTVRAIASLIDLSAGQELAARRIDFDDRAGAVAVAFSPLGDYAFVALQGSNSVAIVDVYSGAIRGALGGAGLAPDGVWIDASARRAFVSNFTTRSVAVYDIANVLDSVSFEPELVRETGSVGVEILGPEELRGLQVFYNARDSRMSLDGYISCASCHLGGGEDGTVWDFSGRGEGLRNTITLNGRKGTALGKLHWTANFDEIQDFENDIRNAFGGAGFMVETEFQATSQPLGAPKAGRSRELDALAAYVASLDDFGRSPYRTADGGITDVAGAGQSLFAELDCRGCHSGRLFTDGQRHDVGTIVASSGKGSGQALADAGFKTPTLLGVWRTAPYFHNGSAPTLAAVVDSRHGGERALAATERDRLVAYLRSLEGPAAESDVLRGAIANLPVSHDGSTEFSFDLTFNREIELSYTTFGSGLLELTGADVTSGRRLEPGSNRGWQVTLQPSGNGPVVIVLPANRSCSEALGVCTADGTRLAQRVAAAVPGPASATTPVATVAAVASPIAEGAAAEFAVSLDTVPAAAVFVSIAVSQTGTVLADPVPPSVKFGIGETRRMLTLETDGDSVDTVDGTLSATLRAGTGYTLGTASSAEVVIQNARSLTAAFESAPASHDGAAAFTVGLRFSEEVALGVAAFIDGVLTVSGGTVRSARRANPPSNIQWEVSVTPAGAAPVVITLPADRACDAVPTVCTSEGLQLSRAATVTVAGPVQAAAPQITGASSLTVLEGDTEVAALAATDADTATADLTWSIPPGAAGGPDGSGFTLTSAGVLALVAAKNFEAPDDANADGAYEVTVQVSDGARSDTADLIVTLSNRNEAPLADAGTDQTDIVAGATVTLSGSGSDADVGDTLTYAWRRSAGPAVALRNADGATATFVAPTEPSAEASFEFTLRVTDAGGLFHEDSVSVVVMARDPEATITANTTPVTEGSPATFTVALDEARSTDLVVSLEISQTGSVLSGASPPSVTVAAGAMRATLSLATLDDAVVEEAGSVTATLAAGVGYTLGAAVSATVTVEDNDAATWSLTAAPSEIEEGAGATLTVSIANGVGFATDQAIALSVSAPDDATLSATTLTLTAGDDAVSATLTATDDAIEESDETVTVTATLDGSELATVDVTIAANDAPTEPTGGAPTPPAGKEWVQVWSDEFDGDALDTTKWGFRGENYRANRNHHGYTIRHRFEDDNVSVRDGKLVLTNARTRLGAGSDEVQAAAVSTKGLHDRTYGYFEARVKVAPIADGVHTAFWLQSANIRSHSGNGGVDGGADGAEVDVMESAYVGDRFHQAVHWDGYGSEHRSTGKDVDLAIHAGYHVFGLEWNAGEYRFYADGELTWTYTGTGLSSSDEFIILSTEASWADGNAHTGDFPNHAYVDWVRVYELRSDGTLSAEADLAALSLSGLDIGTFAAATTAYSATAAESVAETTVTATANDAGASVTITDADGSTSGTSRDVVLDYGENTITVTVTAADGETTGTVTITVTRAYTVPVATIDAGSSPVTEGTAAAFTVTLDKPTRDALAVAVSVSETGAMLSATPSSVAIAADATEATLTLATTDDSVVESDSTVTATLAAGDGYTVGPENSAEVAVEDDDAATWDVSATRPRSRKATARRSRYPSRTVRRSPRTRPSACRHPGRPQRMSR